jgi:hypothetical protein
MTPMRMFYHSIRVKMNSTTRLLAEACSLQRRRALVGPLPGGAGNVSAP